MAEVIFFGTGVALFLLMIGTHNPISNHIQRTKWFRRFLTQLDNSLDGK